jgi:dGTPase
MRAQDELTEREALWGTTMRGHLVEGIERAHADSSATVATGARNDRLAREALEAATLRPGATLSHGAGTRATEEAPDTARTCFERDRDRILHASAFRRLAGKTQVFVFPDDHQRTRLTHALEVAQVARSLSWALSLNVPLAEAIALGHDCGHGPGGHASEDALSSFLDDGFDHAVWGADVTLQPLNLCVETLDGIRNHSWSRPAPATPEAEVVSWADRIAYVCHDFEDAVTAGVVRTEELPAEIRDFCGTSRRTQLAGFINAMIEATERTGQIGMSEQAAAALASFRAFNYERIYLRPESRNQAERVVRVLQALVEHLCQTPSRLPARLLLDDSDSALRHASVAWVAGMTDRYAITAAHEWLGWETDRLPAGIDLPGS